MSLNCYSQTKLNVTAFNPSQDTSQEVDVCYNLPSEFKPEDIIDDGGLKINYDVRRAVYCLEKKGVELKPQELHKFIVEINDIWKIDEKEINFIKQYTQGLIDLLAGLSFKVKTGEEINSKLEKIIALEKERLPTFKKRRENYQQSLEILAEINKKISSLEFLCAYKGVLPQNFIEQSKFLSDLEKEGVLLKENSGRAEFNLKIINPSPERKEGWTSTHYLPREIMSEDVWGKEDWELEYDLGEKTFYLSKKLDLEPGESKVYKIALRDVWKIDLEKLNLFKDYGRKAVDFLKGSSNYSLGVEIEKDIAKMITQITANQEKDQSLEMRIGAFRDNLNRIKKLKENIKKLEKLALKVEIGTISKASNFFKQTRRSLFGFILPPPQTIWRMIWIIIIFLGIFGSAFFILQYSHHRLITTDELTGGFTRRYGVEILNQELKDARKKGGECSIIMIDFDHFKEINDRYGHTRGNTVLRIASNRIKRFLAKKDAFIRYGGEEFLIVLPQSNKSEAVSLAEKIRGEFEKEDINIADGNLTLTLSLGVASFPQDSQNRKGLIEAADNALYRAKQGGRNRARSV